MVNIKFFAFENGGVEIADAILSRGLSFLGAWNYAAIEADEAILEKSKAGAKIKTSDFNAMNLAFTPDDLVVLSMGTSGGVAEAMKIAQSIRRIGGFTLLLLPNVAIGGGSELMRNCNFCANMQHETLDDVAGVAQTFGTFVEMYGELAICAKEQWRDATRQFTECFKHPVQKVGTGDAKGKNSVAIATDVALEKIKDINFSNVREAMICIKTNGNAAAAVDETVANLSAKIGEQAKKFILQKAEPQYAADKSRAIIALFAD